MMLALLLDFTPLNFTEKIFANVHQNAKFAKINWSVVEIVQIHLVCQFLQIEMVHNFFNLHV